MTNSTTFVLFGATGDLAKRKIYPALYNLFLEKKLTLPFYVVGLGRRELTNETFQKNVRESIKEFSRQLPQENDEFNAFIESFGYCSLNNSNTDDFRKLLVNVSEKEEQLGLSGNRLFYLSVAPEFFDIIAQNIQESGLGNTKGWKKLIIEKPFGHDLHSARVLNEKLSKAFEEQEIYRIDHYLGKAMVQNIEAIRFANPFIESLWSNKHIANVQITASETVGVEERAAYYDHSGAIRDMVQNHMLQMLMMVAMEPATETGDIRDEKIKALKSIKPMTTDGVGDYVVRAQYIAGTNGKNEVVGYKDEPGVSADTTTDTFIAAKFMLENERWSGVPFYIRTGKRMKEKSTRIVVEFKGIHNEKFKNVAPNLLTIQVNPFEGISLTINSKNVLNNGDIETLHIEHMDNSKNVPEAYERLIFDAIRGDSSFFARWDEVEYAWELVQPILNAFEENVKVCEYPAGSQGPREANELLEKDGFIWWE